MIVLVAAVAHLAEAEASERLGLSEAALPSTEIGTPAARAGEVGDPSPAIPERARSGNPLWAIPISKLSATQDRPLFSASRRPPPPAVSAAPGPPPSVEPPPPQLPPFTLVGTIIGGADRIGIFLNETSKTATKIRQGEGDSGWTLRSIDPRSAVFEGHGQMVTVEFPTVRPSIGGPAALRMTPGDRDDGG
jgi:general secretion pathway protein N